MSSLRRRSTAFSYALVAGLIFAQARPAQSAELTNSERRQAFLKVIQRPVVPLNVKLEAQPRDGDLAVEQLLFSSDSANRIDALVYKPANARGRLPVVIVLHGTGGTKERMIPLSKDFAKAGVLAVAMDGRFHGPQYGPDNGTPLYFKAMADAYRTGSGHPFLFDSVWDIMRLIDYLETRSDVDASRIGLIGLSKGGMEGWLAAAADPRIYALVPLISVQSFRYEVDHDAWQARIGSLGSGVENAAKYDGVSKIDGAFARKFFDRIAPGLTSDFDGPAMIPLIAPRALLAVSGEVDPRNPLPSVMQITDTMRAAYAKAGKPENFDLIIEKGTAHAVTPEAMEQATLWLIKQLTTKVSSIPNKTRTQ